MLQSPFRAFFIFVVEGLVPCSSKSFYKIMCPSVWNSFFSEIIQWFVFFFKKKLLCLESACIRSYSGPHFPAFGLNRERYWRDTLSLRIQSECGDTRTRTMNTDTFYAVLNTMLQENNNNSNKK